jgi:aspartate carbamoyltransferase catalytic subunit
VVASSVVKGESIRDTVQTLAAMEPDVLVVRHAAAGVPHYAAALSQQVAVINAGDGMHEHPTQALLDLMTILDHRPSLDGSTVLIVGDVAHSRVARSNIRLLGRFGARVLLCGPPTLIPEGIDRLGAEIEWRLDRALDGADVVMCLRAQRERQQEVFFPSDTEYFTLFGLDAERLRRASPDVLIMHPGPVNRGVELAPDVVDGPNSVILEQVSNGVAIRMALLCLVTETEV